MMQQQLAGYMERTRDLPSKAMLLLLYAGSHAGQQRGLSLSVVEGQARPLPPFRYSTANQQCKEQRKPQETTQGTAAITGTCGILLYSYSTIATGPTPPAVSLQPKPCLLMQWVLVEACLSWCSSCCDSSSL